VTKAEGSRRVVVGIADLKVTDQRDEYLVTYALGSCLGVTVYDPEAGVGGMLHAMLPTATVDPDQSRDTPGRYVDSGLTTLFHQMYRMGARKERIVLKVAGGASALKSGQVDSFQVGKRNYVALKKLLWKNGVLIQGEDIGGNGSRTMTMEVDSGQVTIKSDGGERPL
jgi:chemotaxis protein CheD